MRTIANWLTVLAAGLAAFGPAVAGAQAYPAKPVRVIVPFPPGGGNDIVGRIVAQRLHEALRETVVVDNRGGAGGTIGTDIVAKAPADGHTMLINNISLAVNATLFARNAAIVSNDWFWSAQSAKSSGVTCERNPFG